MAIKTLYRGATDKITFNVMDCATGANLDISGLIVSVMFRYENDLKTLSDGFSSDPTLPGTLNITDASNGAVEVQLAKGDSATAELGSLDMHVQVSDAPGNNIQKYVVEDVLEVLDHAL